MTTHTHTHAHDATPVLAPRVRRRAGVILALALVPVLLATVLGAVLLWPSGEERPVLQTVAPGIAAWVVRSAAAAQSTASAGGWLTTGSRGTSRRG